MSFADHFSEKSDLYATARPRYPDALFAFIAGACLVRDRAWDCATGSGQAAVGLAGHFAAVEASDASEQQIANAVAHARVHYSVQRAEHTDFAPASFDAVCVAQALHWFELERFYAEARRVLKPGGIVAAWGYDVMRVAPCFDGLFAEDVLAALEPYWPPQNRLLWAGYQTIAFPFARIEAPPFTIEAWWSFAQFRDYVMTWSAVRRLLEAKGDEYLAPAWRQLEQEWGAEASKRIVMPLHLLCGRHGRH
jgi:ubiquinone/menaquinone biosynthesis C-methylase UbiE